MATEKQVNVAKEIVAALIGIGIASSALYMLAHTYNFGAQNFGDESLPGARAMKEAYVRQKDMLLYALSLLGTVLGYYLGRVPAERGEIRARQEADKARIKLTETDADLGRTRTELSVSQQKRNRLAAATQQLVREGQEVISSKGRKTTLSGGEEEFITPERLSALHVAVENAEQALID